MELTAKLSLDQFLTHISDKLNESTILAWAEKQFELKPFKLHQISMK